MRSERHIRWAECDSERVILLHQELEFGSPILVYFSESLWLIAAKTSDISNCTMKCEESALDWCDYVLLPLRWGSLLGFRYFCLSFCSLFLEMILDYLRLWSFRVLGSRVIGVHAPCVTMFPYCSFLLCPRPHSKSLHLLFLT